MTLGTILSEPQNFSLPLVVIWWEEADWGLSPGPHTKSLALNFILESMRCTIDLHALCLPMKLDHMVSSNLKPSSPYP